MKKKTTRQKSKANKGLSLVETVLAMGIVVMMIGFITGAYINYNKGQKVVAATARLEQVFKEAKSNAAAHKIDCNVCGGADHTCDGVNDIPLIGWNVTITTGTGNPGYTLQGNCGGNLFMTRNESFSGIDIETLHATSVTFRTQGQGTDLTQNLYVNVSKVGGTQTPQFMISPGGEMLPPLPTPTPTPLPTPTPTPIPSCGSVGGTCRSGSCNSHGGSHVGICSGHGQKCCNH